MEPTNSLTQFYDDLKKGKPDMGLSRPANVHMIGAPNSPGTIAWRNKALHHCDALKNKCCKHILLDIYCKILPFDKGYIDHHQGQMCGDIDNFLAHKGMTATQYLTSCYEATKAPLLEFILRSTDNIGKGYMKEADDILKDSQGEEIQEPREPGTTDDDVEGQLVDVKEDPEYENFIDKLKQKTIQKIVDDVSALIDKSKEENDMTFDTKPNQDAVAQESAVGIGMDYLQKKLWNSGIEFTEEQREEMIGMAIREATLRQLDIVFKQPGNTFREFVSTIFYDKGVIINESAVEVFEEWGMPRAKKTEVKELVKKLRSKTRNILAENDIIAVTHDQTLFGYFREGIKRWQIIWDCYTTPKIALSIEKDMNKACAEELGDAYKIAVVRPIGRADSPSETTHTRETTTSGSDGQMTKTGSSTTKRNHQDGFGHVIAIVEKGQNINESALGLFNESKTGKENASIVDKIKSIKGLGSTGGCSLKQLRDAEEELGITFPKEYVDYVRNFGCIDFGSTEWTGLNVKGPLNTVTATKKAQSVNDTFPAGFFVLENLYIDGVMVVVNEAGKVYLLQYKRKKLICDSISEYLDMCIKREDPTPSKK